MLDSIATEGGGKPPFLGQAPATVFIGADRMGQGIAKNSPGIVQASTPGLGNGNVAAEAVPFFYAGETPEGASNVGRRHKPRVKASSAWVSPWCQGRAQFPSRIPRHERVRPEPMTADCVHSMAISHQGRFNSTPTGDFTAQLFYTYDNT